MNSTNIDITGNKPINITPMTLAEARECVATIKANLESLAAMLLDLDRRRGWEALGYRNFRECAIAEFGKSQGYVYKLLHAAKVDENLAASEIYPMDKSSIALIPTSHKEELHKLPSSQQAEALKKADALAQAEGKPREFKHVAKAVKEIKSVVAETEAKGKSLGLPTRGNSTLPESDRIDELTHDSPADVDDRLFASATSQHQLTRKHDYEKQAPTDMTQDNARLEESLRLCEERAQRLEQQNSELVKALQEAQAKIKLLTSENLKLHNEIAACASRI